MTKPFSDHSMSKGANREMPSMNKSGVKIRYGASEMASWVNMLVTKAQCLEPMEEGEEYVL